MALPVRRHDNDTRPSRWDPIEELDRLTDQLQSYLGNWNRLPSLLGDAFTPLADVEETDDAYLVEVEVPGVKKPDIDISLAGRRVTVSGERKERERAGVLRRRTRSTGRFRYEVTLPGDVDEDGVSASLDDGVLTVRVPKAVSERPRRIEVH